MGTIARLKINQCSLRFNQLTSATCKNSIFLKSKFVYKDIKDVCVCVCEREREREREKCEINDWTTN